MTSTLQNGDAGYTGIPVSHCTGITGAILAGGRSSRMGTDKALLEIGGIPLIQRVRDILSTLFPHLILITNTPDCYRFLGIPMAGDIYPNEGSLAGIHAALSHAPTDLVFVVACDMPFISPAVVRHLCGLTDGCDAVVPESPDGIEPLHAIYRRSCLPVMEQMLCRGEKRIRDLLNQVQTCRLSWDDLSGLPGARQSFLNLNTPQEFAAALQEL